MGKTNRVLTDEELRRLLSQPPVGRPVGLRNLAIMALMLETGAKSGELVGKEGAPDDDQLSGGLRLGDIDIPGRTITLRKPKDGSTRQVKLPETSAGYLAAWLEVRPKSDSDLVFLTSRGTRLMNRYVRRMLKEQGSAAGIEVELKPSLLRHTFARRHLSQTGDLAELADALGHKQIISSARYALGEGHS